VERRGRHRYYHLASAEVATVLEQIARVAPPIPVRSLRGREQADALRLARPCYDHLAGRVGVALTDALVDRDALRVEGSDVAPPPPASPRARAIHLHPRDAEGRERLDAEVIDAVVVQVRNACGLPVGVSTGAWIEPGFARRLALAQPWRAPDYASVNLSEPGATEVMRALIRAGVGIEAGVWTVEDAERLAASGLGGQVTRILVEPVAVSPADAIGLVDGIHRALDRLGLTAPRLQHGDGEATWVLLADTLRRGLDTRIGLEDTLHEPDGARTTGNAALVRAARALGAGID